MPDPQGYEYWEVTDPRFPFPVEEIDVSEADEYVAGAHSRICLPNAIPKDKTYAERSVGIKRSWRFTFGLRADRDSQGRIKLIVECTAKHAMWFPKHTETGPGPVQVFQIAPSQVKGELKSLLKDGIHGPHFDRVELMYWLAGDGCVVVWFFGQHKMTGTAGVVDEPTITPAPSSGKPPTGPQPPPPLPPSPPSPPIPPKKEEPKEPT